MTLEKVTITDKLVFAEDLEKIVDLDDYMDEESQMALGIEMLIDLRLSGYVIDWGTMRIRMSRNSSGGLVMNFFAKGFQLEEESEE